VIELQRLQSVHCAEQQNAAARLVTGFRTTDSGVTTGPAMRGARGPVGAQNYGINFFH